MTWVIHLWGIAPLDLAMQMMLASPDSRVLLAVPFFILSGAIIAESSVGQRLVDLFNALFGLLPGGLAVSAIFTCFLFGGLTGSAVAETAGVTSILSKPMARRGCPPPFAASLIACAGTNANLVPPSIALLIYGIVAKTLISALFIAGVLPGLLFASLLAASAMIVAAARGYGSTGRVAERLPLGRALMRAGWALLAPVWIVGGLRTGVLTPGVSQVWIVLLMLLVLVVAGMFLDAASLLLIIAPILLPVARGIEMNLVQFGIFVTLAINLGLVTPPVGVSLYVTAKVADVPVLQAAWASLPWIAVFLLTTLLFAFVPAVSLILL